MVVGEEEKCPIKINHRAETRDGARTFALMANELRLLYRISLAYLKLSSLYVYTIAISLQHTFPGIWNCLGLICL
jgi:hypothetical protein